MSRVTAPRRDGTVDGSIIAHEWGPLPTTTASSPAAARSAAGQSEGWGDFSALYMSIRASDDLAGTFAVGQYATSGITNDAGYFGLRRFPYSADMTRDPLTFGHIANGAALPANAPMNPVAAPNAEVHNTSDTGARSDGGRVLRAALHVAGPQREAHLQSGAAAHR